MRTPAPLALLALAACRGPAPPAAPLEHRAYVWQRDWTPAVATAVEAARETFDGVTILGVEHEPGGPRWTGLWHTPAPPDAAGLALRWSTLERALEAATAQSDAEELLARAAAAGILVHELHLDADVPTARLPEWAAVVEGLADTLPVPLAVLCLPDHIGKPGWQRLDAAADRLVVQVHSVPLPAAEGPVLLDPARATGWLEAARAASTGAVSVALPTHRLTDRRSGAEVRAEPGLVAAWLPTLGDLPAPGTAGVDWFRLPVPGDPDTWTAEALAAVRAGAVPAAGCTAALVPPPASWGAHPAARLVELRATGPDHLWLPSVTLCSDEPFAAAALDGGYRAAPRATEGPDPRCQSFAPRAQALLAPGRTRKLLLVSATGGVRLQLTPPCPPAPEPAP